MSAGKIALLILMLLSRLVFAKPFTQQLYEDTFRTRCEDASAAEINILSRCLGNPPTTLRALDQMSEQIVFEPIVRSELAHFSCLENLFSKIEKDPKIKNQTVANTCGHLEELKNLIGSLKYFTDLLASYQKANDPKIRFVSKEDFQKLDAVSAELVPLISSIADRIQLLRAGDLLLSSDEIFNKIYSKLEHGLFTDGQTSGEVCSYLHKQSGNFFTDDREANAKSKEFLSSVYLDGKWLTNTDLKEALWSSASRKVVTEKLESTNQLGTSALCRMEARYGKGAEMLEKLSLIGKLGLGLGTAGLSRLLSTVAYAKATRPFIMIARTAVIVEVSAALSVSARDAIKNCEAKVAAVSSRKLCIEEKDAPVKGVLSKQAALNNCLRQASLLAFQVVAGSYSVPTAFKSLGTPEQIIEAQIRLKRLYPRQTSDKNIQPYNY